MELNLIDASIVILYLAGVAILGIFIQKKASAKLENYYLAGRNVPWWMLGIAGCSSYIDIGGTMAMVGALFYLGLKSVWMPDVPSQHPGSFQNEFHSIQQRSLLLNALSI